MDNAGNVYIKQVAEINGDIETFIPEIDVYPLGGIYFEISLREKNSACGFYAANAQHNDVLTVQNFTIGYSNVKKPRFEKVADGEIFECPFSNILPGLDSFDENIFGDGKCSDNFQEQLADYCDFSEAKPTWTSESTSIQIILSDNNVLKGNMLANFRSFLSKYHL